MDIHDNFYLLSQQTVTHLPLPTIEEVWSAIHCWGSQKVLTAHPGHLELNERILRNHQM